MTGWAPSTMAHTVYGATSMKRYRRISLIRRYRVTVAVGYHDSRPKMRRPNCRNMIHIKGRRTQ